MRAGRATIAHSIYKGLFVPETCAAGPAGPPGPSGGSAAAGMNIMKTVRGNGEPNAPNGVPTPIQ